MTPEEHWSRLSKIDRNYVDLETGDLKRTGESIVRRARRMALRPTEEDLHLIENVEMALTEALLAIKLIRNECRAARKPSMQAAE